MPLLGIEFAALNKDGTTAYVLKTLSIDVGSNPTRAAKQPIVPVSPSGGLTLVTFTADLPVEAAIGPGPNPFIGGTIRTIDPKAALSFAVGAGLRIAAVEAASSAAPSREASSAFVTGQGPDRMLQIAVPAAALGVEASAATALYLIVAGGDEATDESVQAVAAALGTDGYIASLLRGTLKVATPLPAAFFAKRIEMSGSPIQLPANVLVSGIIGTAAQSNASPVYWGPSSASVAAIDGTGDGYPVPPGGSVSEAVSNSNAVWVNGAAGTVLYTKWN